MMNSKWFFFIKFLSKENLEVVLLNFPWMISMVTIILKTCSICVCVSKEDLRKSPMWVKLLDVPMAAFTCDGLSIASKLGTHVLHDSFTNTMCEESWG